MRNKILVLLVFLFIAAAVTAQRKLADSIENILAKKMPDSLRALAMVNRAMYYEVIDSAKAQQLYREALDFAVSKKLYYEAGLCIRFRIVPDITQGLFSKHTGDIELALHYLSLSDHPKAKMQAGTLMGDKGSSFSKEGKYDSAIVWTLKGISLLEKMNRFDKTPTLYINIASYYEILGLKEKQREYIGKSLADAKRSGLQYNIFPAYLMFAQLFNTQNEFAKALQYCDSSLLFYNDGINGARMQLYYIVRAAASEGLKQYDSSVYYYTKAYETAKLSMDTWGMTEPLQRIGYGSMKLGKTAEAEHFLKAGIELAEQNDYTVFKRSGYELLAGFYEEQGDYKNALAAYRKYYAAADTLNADKTKKLVLELDKKYETAKKEQQLQLQQADIAQKQWLNYILAAGLALLIFVSALLYRNYKQKQRLQQQQITELEKEKQLFATQSLLKGQEEERSRLAKDLHDGLGGLLSGVKLQLGAMKGNLILSEEHGRIFNNALGKLDESISEMRRVAHNMMPEALMKLGLQQALQDYCDGLSEGQSFKINGEFHGLENRMEPATEVVVYRIVQELLNNAVKHSGATTILAQVMQQDNNLTITVEDNGKGFDRETVLQGAGLKNIRSRVDYLKGQLDIQSVPGKGTSVHIDCIT